MSTLADLLRELQELGIHPGDIDIPDSWYQQIIDQAEELCDEMEENEDV